MPAEPRHREGEEEGVRHGSVSELQQSQCLTPESLREKEAVMQSWSDVLLWKEHNGGTVWMALQRDPERGVTSRVGK